ncbi:unnamed protein product [Closterium sp. Yama58-4]|nr:unnamed protein product [Closterium sp. Yama58-4]
MPAWKTTNAGKSAKSTPAAAAVALPWRDVRVPAGQVKRETGVEAEQQQQQPVVIELLGDGTDGGAGGAAGAAGRNGAEVDARGASSVGAAQTAESGHEDRSSLGNRNSGRGREASHGRVGGVGGRGVGGSGGVGAGAGVRGGSGANWFGDRGGEDNPINLSDSEGEEELPATNAAVGRAVPSSSDQPLQQKGQQGQQGRVQQQQPGQQVQGQQQRYEGQRADVNTLLDVWRDDRRAEPTSTFNRSYGAVERADTYGAAAAGGVGAAGAGAAGAGAGAGGAGADADASGMVQGQEERGQEEGEEKEVEWRREEGDLGENQQEEQQGEGEMVGPGRAREAGRRVVRFS